MNTMRPRLIPVLLLDRDRRIVKTVRFGKRTYIGDPFNIVRLFNEKEVDEICMLDIDVTRDGRTIDTGFLTELAAECFMPLSYGGGIAAGAPVDALARAGVEKFVVGTAAPNHSFVRSLADTFGSQAIVGCVDYRNDESPTAFATGGTVSLNRDPLDHARALQDAGAGEIILQSIDRDGIRQGMDLDLIARVSSAVGVPLVALGGAGDVSDLEAALAAGASAAASGSVFSFIGRLRAVLINYPSRETLCADPKP